MVIFFIITQNNNNRHSWFWEWSTVVTACTKIAIWKKYDASIMFILPFWSLIMLNIMLASEFVKAYIDTTDSSWRNKTIMSNRKLSLVQCTFSWSVFTTTLLLWPGCHCYSSRWPHRSATNVSLPAAADLNQHSRCGAPAKLSYH